MPSRTREQVPGRQATGQQYNATYKNSGRRAAGNANVKQLRVIISRGESRDIAR